MLKSAAAGFVDDVLVGKRVEFWDSVVPGFTADEETAEGSGVANANTGGVVSAAV